MLIGIAIEIPFALGEALLGVEAYFIRDWKTLQIVAYLPLLCKLVLVHFISFEYFIHFSTDWPVLGGSRISEVVDWSG